MENEAKEGMDKPAACTPERYSAAQKDNPSSDDEIVILSSTNSASRALPNQQQRLHGVPAPATPLAYYGDPYAQMYSPAAAAVFGGPSYYPAPPPPPIPYATRFSFPFAVTYWYPAPPVVSPYYGSGAFAAPTHHTSLASPVTSAPTMPTTCDDDGSPSSHSDVKHQGKQADPVPQVPTSAPVPPPELIQRKWQPHEDRKLRSLVQRLGASKMEEVASKLPGWTVDDCRSRWNSMVRPRRPWTNNEDQRLREFVPRYSSVDHNDEVVVDWTRVSKAIKSRLATQCQGRWEDLVAKGVVTVPPLVPSSSKRTLKRKHSMAESTTTVCESIDTNCEVKHEHENVRPGGRSRVPDSQVAAIQAIVTGRLQPLKTPRKRKERPDAGEGPAGLRRSRRNSKL